jgi:nitronate monooxygenase
VRQTATDIARGYEWPSEFTGRVLHTDFVRRWHGWEKEHRAQTKSRRAAYLAAVADGRTNEVGVFVGEAIGLMQDVRSTETVMDDIVGQASDLLGRRAPALLA